MSFDGSSTKQAESGEGKNTNCLLNPVFITKDPFRGGDNKLVFCEVLNPDGMDGINITTISSINTSTSINKKPTHLSGFFNILLILIFLISFLVVSITFEVIVAFLNPGAETISNRWFRL